MGQSPISGRGASTRWSEAQLWAAFMLARDRETCASLLAGQPVLAFKLDVIAFQRALRGTPLPHYSSWVTVTPEMLDSISEGGGFGRLAESKHPFFDASGQPIIANINVSLRGS